MIDTMKRELHLINSPVRCHLNELVVLSTGILSLILEEHHSIAYRWTDALIFYALVPLLTITFVLRRNPMDFGLRLGNWKLWRFHVLGMIIIGTPILFFASKIDSLSNYYHLSELDLLSYSLQSVLYFTAWEFLFRGYLLFGLRERFREGAILIQMIPFVLLHFGKPEIEILSTIPMGLYFGYVAYRTNSIWPAVIIHLLINIPFRVFVNWF